MTAAAIAMRVLLLAPLLSACESCIKRLPSQMAASAPTSEVPPAAVHSTPSPGLSLLNELGRCEISHQGILIDLGKDAANQRRAFSAGPFSDVSNQIRSGKTVAAFSGREVSYDFWLQRTSEPLSVALRGRAGRADKVSVYLDDERLGNLKLPSTAAGVVISAPGKHELTAGRHSITLRFAGGRRTEDEAYAEIDWLWVGNREELTENYAPPTLDDIVSDVVLGGQPNRSIVLRVPATVRCVVKVVRDEQLDLAVGHWGEGQGTAQVRALVEGEAPVVLAEYSLQGGERAQWQTSNLDLSRFAGKMLTLEMSALQSTGSGRIAFGEPTLRVHGAMPAAVVAQNVVLVVSSGLSHAALPPWTTMPGFRAMTELARQGVTFNGYRTRSTSASAVVTSLLTGMSPRMHTVEDAEHRLPATVFTLAEMLKQQGVQSVMFTGVPTTFEASGLNRGWDRFVTISPISDLPAAEPISQATAWLADSLRSNPETRRFLVIQTRGGHPPWDLSREEAAALPPEEYGGVLEARRGGIILSQLRTRAPSTRSRLRQEDWTRLQAMQSFTLRRQDQAIARLMDLLQERGQWDRTLFVFVADVPMGAPPSIPFGVAPLSEDRLLAPLLVKFPAGFQAGRQVSASCTTEDITRTMADALGLVDHQQIEGQSLLNAADDRELPAGRPLVAMMGNQFATRWGPWLLLGEFGSVPRLCQVEVDPSCVNDLFSQHPASALALWHGTFESSQRRPTAKSERAVPDEETRAALLVWGD
jgi:hypothetical protein